MDTENFLLDICKERGITLSELGKRLNRTKQYMSALGRGNIALTYEMAARIAVIFNTTPDKLFWPTVSNKIRLAG